MNAFRLDERLARETVLVGESPLSLILLMNDARYPWAILVPRRGGLVEFDDLSPAERSAVAEEIAAVSQALRKLTGAAKINIGALGNIVRQLHIHIVARRDGDDAWPGPAWGFGAARPYADGEAQAFAAALKEALGI